METSIVSFSFFFLFLSFYAYVEGDISRPVEIDHENVSRRERQEKKKKEEGGDRIWGNR